LNHFEGIGIKKLKKYDNLSKYLDEKNSKSVPKSHLHYLDEDGYDSLIKKLKNKTNELTEKKEKAQKELKDMRNYGKQEAQQNIEVKQQIIALKQEWNQYYASFFNT
jgi:hypothetical protein